MSAPRFISEAVVERSLTARDVVDAVEAVTRAHGLGEAFNNPRQRVKVPGGVLHLMGAAWPARGMLGYKAYTSFKDAVRFLVHGFDVVTGAPLCIAEGNRLGQLRTGAATAVAVKHLAARTDKVALIGTGFQAWGQLECVAAIAQIGKLHVHSRTPASREQFARRAKEQLGVNAFPDESAEAAVRDADVVIACTTSATPVVQGGWLKAGALVCGVGANSISRREVDNRVLARSQRIVVDSIDQARLESGALVMAAETGRFHWERVTELGHVLAGRASGRSAADETLVFLSHGLALWDVASLAALWAKVEAQSLPPAYSAS